jgi:hypothetical protein
MGTLIPASHREEMKPHENVTPHMLDNELTFLIAEGVIAEADALIPRAMVTTQLEKGRLDTLDPYMARALRLEIVRAARGKVIALFPYDDL